MATGNHHDTFFKLLLQLDRYTIQLLEQLLPQELLPLLDLESMERVAGSFISSDQRESHSDALIKIPLRQGGDLYLYLLIEHKSRPDPDIHLQLLDYLHSIYRQQKTPIPVIPIVFYHGQPEWNIPLSFGEQFMGRFRKRLREQFRRRLRGRLRDQFRGRFRERLRRQFMRRLRRRRRAPGARIEERIIGLLKDYLPNFSCYLYDLSRQRYERVGLAPGLEVSLLVMRNFWDLRNVDFLRRLESGLKLLLKEDKGLFKNIVAYLIAGDRQRLDLLKEHISSVEVSKKMDMVQFFAEKARREGIAEGKEAGIAEGKAEGIAEGEEKGREMAVRALYSHRMSRSEIARNLNLPLEQVERYLSRQQ